MNRPLKLCAGDEVEVLSKDEILATLDQDGRLEGLPFMPEMFQFCGRQLKVYKRAHKTCDPSLGIQGRRMLHTVHLEGLRCDGGAHDNCEAGCLLFWKEAWLKRPGEETQRLRLEATARCTEHDVEQGTRGAVDSGTGERLYVCQNTHLKEATVPLRWWDLRQFI
jgi:hypothetical protein